jgi:hypothetical protein
LIRSAIVSRRGESNTPGGFEDPIHQPLIDFRRAEWGSRESEADLKYRCPRSHQARKSTVTIQPVRIARDDGSSPTAAPQMGVAQMVWDRCCISLNVKPVHTLNRTDFQRITDTGPRTPPTVEEQDLQNTLGSDTQVNVVSIREWDVGGKIDTTNRGGGTVFGRGSVNPMVLAVDIATAEMVAHEIGHALGFGGHAGADGTIMDAQGSPTAANPTKVSDIVCRGARTAPVHTFSGPPTCCQRYY